MNKKHPETEALSHAFDPKHAQMAIKTPIYQTSTFIFSSAEEGKRTISEAYGLSETSGGDPGMFYSRINHPNMELVEKRICLWDGAEEAAVFESGMAAISTALLTFLRPGDLILCNAPIYSGTDSFIKRFLVGFGVRIMEFEPDESPENVRMRLKDADLSESLKMVYLETPANPTNSMIDLELWSDFAHSYNRKDRNILVAADNTYMGPLWQSPLRHGVDLVLYSATKYMGGHSDLLAGAVLGSKKLVSQIKSNRTLLGNATSPHTAWLLTRSLETMTIRMNCQAQNAEVLANYLNDHGAVSKVYFPGILRKTDARIESIMQRQCSGNGAMISFDIHGGEAEAFAFLNKLRTIKLAVSLGSTESLVQHPATMTHVAVSDADKKKMNITGSLIRISAGIEHVDDLLSDLKQALEPL